MLPQPLNLKPWQWPARDAYAPGLFLELGDELLTVVFRLTGRRLPWDVYALTEITGARDLMRHARVLDGIFVKIAGTPADEHFPESPEFIYERGSVPPSEQTVERLKGDLIESFTLLRDMTLHAANTRKTLCIVGF